MGVGVRIRGEGAPTPNLRYNRPRATGNGAVSGSARWRYLAVQPGPGSALQTPALVLGRPGGSGCFLGLACPLAGGTGSRPGTLSWPPAARARAAKAAASSFLPCSAPLPARNAWQRPSRFGLAADPGPVVTGPRPVLPVVEEACSPGSAAAGPGGRVSGAGDGPGVGAAGSAPPTVTRMLRAASRTGPGRWPVAAPATPPVASAPTTTTAASPTRRRRRGVLARRRRGRPGPGHGPQLGQGRRLAGQLLLGAARPRWPRAAGHPGIPGRRLGRRELAGQQPLDGLLVEGQRVGVGVAEWSSHVSRGSVVAVHRVTPSPRCGRRRAARPASAAPGG